MLVFSSIAPLPPNSRFAQLNAVRPSLFSSLDFFADKYCASMSFGAHSRWRRSSSSSKGRVGGGSRAQEVSYDGMHLGSHKAQQLLLMLSRLVMLRRLKADVLSLPPKRREVLLVENVRLGDTPSLSAGLAASAKEVRRMMKLMTMSTKGVDDGNEAEEEEEEDEDEDEEARSGDRSDGRENDYHGEDEAGLGSEKNDNRSSADADVDADVDVDVDVYANVDQEKHPRDCQIRRRAASPTSLPGPRAAVQTALVRGPGSDASTSSVMGLFTATARAKTGAVIGILKTMLGVDTKAAAVSQSVASSTSTSAASASSSSSPSSSLTGPAPLTKVLVFAHHRFMLDAVQSFLRHHGVRHIRIDGATPPSQRQQLANAFQTDPAVRVGLLSISAAGVGLTLTAAHTALFTELTWTPAMLLQAEDRIYRIGQTKPVRIVYVVALNTLDDVIWPILVRIMFAIT